MMSLRAIAILLAFSGVVLLALAFSGLTVPGWVALLGVALIGVALTMVMAQTLFAMFPGSKR